jgi:hypothetical protein
MQIHGTSLTSRLPYIVEIPHDWRTREAFAWHQGVCRQDADPRLSDNLAGVASDLSARMRASGFVGFDNSEVWLALVNARNAGGFLSHRC